TRAGRAGRGAGTRAARLCPAGRAAGRSTTAGRAGHRLADGAVAVELGVVGLLGLGLVLQRILAEAGADDLVALHLELVERHGGLLLADAEEAADADHDARLLAGLADHDVVDLADALVLGVVDVLADEVADLHLLD